MVNPPLVDSQIDDGEKIVEQLDRDEFDVDSAFWFFDPDREKWRFMIATSLVSEVGPKESYDRLRTSLGRLPEKIQSRVFDISLIKPTDSIVMLLKKVTKVKPGISRIRFTGNIINGTLIEDALIYRLGVPQQPARP